jgi:8-oxo-dGTP pyrophosphatase MutT (NUDIX family)
MSVEHTSHGPIDRAGASAELRQQYPSIPIFNADGERLNIDFGWIRGRKFEVRQVLLPGSEGRMVPDLELFFGNGVVGMPYCENPRNNGQLLYLTTREERQFLDYPLNEHGQAIVDSFPGGSVEKDERPFHAVTREVSDELRLPEIPPTRAIYIKHVAISPSHGHGSVGYYLLHYSFSTLEDLLKRSVQERMRYSTGQDDIAEFVGPAGLHTLDQLKDKRGTSPDPRFHIAVGLIDDFERGRGFNDLIRKEIDQRDDKTIFASTSETNEEETA